MDFRPQFTITNAITSGLTQIERARGFLDAAALSESWLHEMSDRALLLEAHHTTHIEGTHLTLDQAQQLWEGKDVPGASRDDTRELLNYRSAFDLVSESLATNYPITEGVIREIHRRLVEGVRGGKATPGEYRKIQNYVANSSTGQVIYTPPGAQEVPAMMSSLVKWLNTETDIHPVLISGISQFQLVHIHPFLDGNGRTSRLLLTLFLYRAGYDFKRLFTISEYYDLDRLAFYKAIQSVRENGMDMTGWLEYFVTGLETQMLRVKERGTQAIKRDVIIQQYGLNERQDRAVLHLLSNGNITLREYEEIYPDTHKRTLQRDLKSMVEAGLICVEGATNKLVYVWK